MTAPSYFVSDHKLILMSFFMVDRNRFLIFIGDMFSYANVLDYFFDRTYLPRII